MTKSAPNLPLIFPIAGVVQNYPWGKLGDVSYVGKLSGKGLSSPNLPFAELWFGAHRSHPSPLTAPQVTPRSDSPRVYHSNLREFLGSNEGTSLSSNELDEPLPFLFKVLSVAKPLSIQLHPNRDEAQALHRRSPHHYPDRNHKPELAVALTEVHLVCGIKPLSELLALRNHLPCLEPLYANLDATFPAHEQVKQLFRNVFSLEAPTRKSIITSLLTLNSDCPQIKRGLDCIMRASAYNAPDDPGLISLLFLTYHQLAPSECVYIGPGIPHAYLSGDLVECMASSDNVVRAGLTEKHIDVEVFLSLVHYEPAFAPRLAMRQTTVHGAVEFRPPVHDFRLFKIQNGEGELSDLASGPGILVCINGQAVLQSSLAKEEWSLQAGDAVYIADLSSQIKCIAMNAEVYLAATN